MGPLDYLKSILPGGRKRMYYNWATNNQPIFTSFGKDIYLSDFVNNAIDRIATEISKIEIKSVNEKGDQIKINNDDITRLFRSRPNPLQTTSDFLANVEWIRRKKNNVFIYPVYEEVEYKGKVFRRYTALYPLNPDDIAIGMDGDKVWEVQFNFNAGESYTIPYSDLIHLRWRRGTSTTIGGGDDHGNVNNYDLIRTIDSLDKTIQGLPKSIEASMQIKGVYSAKTLADQNKLAKIRDNFEEHLSTSKSGMIATDLAGEFTPVRITPPSINDTALKFLKGIIQERYGISAAILSGDFNAEQHEAFYQSVIEDFIIEFEQAMTSTLFTQREQDIGHKVKCYYNKVMYMSSREKLELANIAKETGMLTLNQINGLFGLSPFEDGDIRLRSLNFVDSSIANEYQLGKEQIKSG